MSCALWLKCGYAFIGVMAVTIMAWLMCAGHYPNNYVWLVWLALSYVVKKALSIPISQVEKQTFLKTHN